MRGLSRVREMKLLGDWNWYLPPVPQRLPRTEPEAPPAREPI
jgi:hypothetical protein